MWFFISQMTITMTRRWPWWWRRRSDVNLKRSDEDKAWERGAVVVSESVFGSSDHFAPEQIWGTGKRNWGTFLLVPLMQNINEIGYLILVTKYWWNHCFLSSRHSQILENITKMKVLLHYSSVIMAIRIMQVHKHKSKCTYSKYKYTRLAKVFPDGTWKWLVVKCFT